MTHDVGHRSPSSIPPWARDEVGERVREASAARSPHLTWAEYCASYKPGQWAPTEEDIEEQAAVLLAVLRPALRYMVVDTYRRPVRLVPPVIGGEETSAGSCYQRGAA